MNQKILLVEDEMMIRKLCERILTRLSYELLTASGVEEAYALMEKAEPDLLISDLKLPDGSGFDVIKKFIGKFQGKKAIIITGSLQVDGLRAQAKGLGVDHFLSKPFEIEELEEAVKNALS